MREFEGRTAVVTGGASGIGRAVGARLARAGMHVVLADVEEAALQETARALASEATASGSVTGVHCDVIQYESVAELARRAVEMHGKVHVLCNNAGIGAHEDVPLWDLPLSDWGWTFAVNIWGVIHGLRAFVPGMLAHGEPGHVVNTSSGNGGLMLVPSTPIYSASKAAVSSITETLHLQFVLQKAQIRASVLYPGPYVVSSKIFDSRRNRPREFAREVPQATEAVTLDTMRGWAEQAGREFQTTSPEEVAEQLFEGLQQDRFFIRSGTPEGDEQIRRRVENVLQGRNPVPDSMW